MTNSSISSRPTLGAVDALSPAEQRRLAALAQGQEKIARAKRQAYAEGEAHGMELSASLLTTAAQQQRVDFEAAADRHERITAQREIGRVRGARAFGAFLGAVGGAIAGAFGMWAAQDAAGDRYADAVQESMRDGVMVGQVQKSLRDGTGNGP